MSPHNFLISKSMKILAAAGLLFAGAIHAENAYESCCLEQCGVSNLQIGVNYTRANIKVDDQSGFDGNLGGVQGIYEYNASNGFYGAVRVAWKEGKAENKHADRRLTYVDAQERLGYTYASYCDGWSATIFSGIGYRYLAHKLIQHEESSIKFDYDEFYIPVGFLADYYFCSDWSIGLNFIWMPQIDSTVEIVPLKGARWILKDTIGNMLVELPLTYFFSADRCYSLVVKPFYERWEDGRSIAKASTGQELDLPKNRYNFWGVEINFALLF